MPSEQFSSLFLLVAVFAAMYFMIIRPQKKQQKALMALRNSLAVGDEIVTIGGIVAKIVAFKGEEDVVVLSEDSKMLFKRNAIARKNERSNSSDTKDDKQAKSTESNA